MPEPQVFSVVDLDTARLPGHRARLADAAPLKLDCGAELGPVTVAYQTYGRLNAQRTNAILVCHALTGDQFAAGSHPVTGKSGWWELTIGPGLPLDTERYFVICANVLGGCMGTTGPVDRNVGDRRAVRAQLPGDHHRRHGPAAGAAARPSRHRAAVLRDRRLDGRDAGAGVGVELSRAGVQRGADRGLGAPFGAEHRLPRGRPPGDHGRSRLAGRQLPEHRPAPDPRPVGRAHGGAHHLSQRGRAAPQVRPRAAGPRTPVLRLRCRLPGRELSAPPGHQLRRPVRCQLLPLHHAGDGLFRPRGQPRRRARQRLPPAPARAFA